VKQRNFGNRGEGRGRSKRNRGNRILNWKLVYECTIPEPRWDGLRKKREKKGSKKTFEDHDSGKRSELNNYGGGGKRKVRGPGNARSVRQTKASKSESDETGREKGKKPKNAATITTEKKIPAG